MVTYAPERTYIYCVSLLRCWIAILWSNYIICIILWINDFIWKYLIYIFYIIVENRFIISYSIYSIVDFICVRAITLLLLCFMKDS